MAAGAANSQELPEFAECSTVAKFITSTPVPPTEFGLYRNYQRHVEQLEELSGSGQVAAIGDSLALRWPEESLASLVPGAQVFRAGMSGDRIQHVLWRIENMELGRISPAMAILSAGVNNLNTGDAACATAFAIVTAVEKVRAVWPETRIFVLAVSGRGLMFANNDERRREVNALVAKALTGRPGVAVIDRTEDLMCHQQGQLNWWQSVQDFYWGAEPACEFYLDDWVHWTPAAYDLIVAEIKKSGQL